MEYNLFEKFLPEIIIFLSWCKALNFFVFYTPELIKILEKIEEFKLRGS